MTPEYVQAVEVKRRPWQRRIEVFSAKLRRRLTLFSRDAQDAWILLEAGPHVQTFCERPAYMEGNAGRVLDFWVDQGRYHKFWIRSTTYAKDRQEIHFATIAGNNILAFHVRVVRRGNRLIYLMVRCRYRT